MKLVNQPCVHCWELHVDHVGRYHGPAKCLFGATTFQGLSHKQLTKVLRQLGTPLKDQNNELGLAEFNPDKEPAREWHLRLYRRGGMFWKLIPASVFRLAWEKVR